MRKIALLLLFLAGCALIFSPIYTPNSTLSNAFLSRAHPSTRPLPDAWQSSGYFQVKDPSAAADADIPVTSDENCAGLYSVQPGDTLGEIAQACGVSLAEMLSANPQIQNPNRVYSGQQVNIPDPMAGRGGGADSSQSLSGAFQPGATIQFMVQNLPPNRAARIGLGLSVSGYRVIREQKTDSGGKIDLTLTLPEDAQPGEIAFILVTIPGTPIVQRMSDSFIIGSR